jgi:IS30 family transposase
MPAAVKRRYFELIRTGLSGSAAGQEVGVSLSCGSLWFIDAGRVSFIDTAISPRYLSQDDRIEIADGLAQGEPVKAIAARIGKTFQSVYREIARNRKPDGGYQPWYAHNRAYQRRRRPKPRRFSVDAELAETVAGKLSAHFASAIQLTQLTHEPVPRIFRAVATPNTRWRARTCTHEARPLTNEQAQRSVRRSVVFPVEHNHLPPLLVRKSS